MRQLHKVGVALLTGLAGLALGGVAEADIQPGAPQTEAPRPPEGQPSAQPRQGTKGLGAGVGGQESDVTTFVLGALDTGGLCESSGTSQGYGAGVGPSSEASASAPAPVPQYWLADASLFVANAGNAAQTLANEQTLGVQAPSVLGNQAQFLLASTDRALSSLKALHANAEATHPRALGDIRSAMDELVAAKGQAKQALDDANNGTLGPGDQGAIRSTYGHLQAAEKALGGVGRAYGVPGFTLASTGAFRGGGRAMGAGIGGAKSTPPGLTSPPAKDGAATPPPANAEPGTPMPAPEKTEPGTPAPQPPPNNEKP